MRKSVYVLLFLVAGAWAFIGCARLYWHIYNAGERRGYERGLYQGVVYRTCKQDWPSQHFVEKNWNLVNMPNDCRYVEAVASK